MSEGAQIFSGTSGSGRGGDVQVQATNVTLADNAVLGSSTSRSGRAGNVIVNADALSASTQAMIVSDTSGSGDAGSVTIEAKNMTVSGAARVDSDTSGSGNGGHIAVSVSESLILDGTGAPGTGFIGGNHAGSTGNSADITVNAKNLTIMGDASISASTSGAGNGGTVHVTAGEAIVLNGGDIIASGNPGSAGKGGNIFVDSTNLTIKGGGQIASSTFGSGNGGKVSVAAKDTIRIEGSDSDPSTTGILSNTTGTGKAGGIVVETKNLTVSGRGGVASSTFGLGDGGTVQVTASENIVLSSTSNGESGIAATSGASGNGGNAGNIIIGAKNITVMGRAQIANGTFSSGNGGKVQVTAADSILLDGTGGSISGGLLFAAGITSSNQPGSTGSPGNIEVDTKNLTIVGGATISSDTFGRAPGGTVKINASDTVMIAGTFAGTAGGSNISTSSLGNGAGGSIEVNAGKIHLNDGALITAESFSSGNAGDIFLNAQEFRSSNSAVATRAVLADGGNIHLKVGSLVDLFDSQITASVGTGFGTGGDITIDPTFVTLNNSQIATNAFGGPGGNIRIAADVFLKSSDSSVTASSALSPPGTVDIQAAITNVSGLLQPLPENIFQATFLLQQSCAARFSGGKHSSLVVGSLVGLPWEPGSFMPSPLYRLDRPPYSLVSLDRAEVRRESLTSALVASAKPQFSFNWPCTK